MEIRVKFDDQSSTKETLKVFNKIGKGKFSVYHVQSASQNIDYALKVFPKDSFGITQYSKEKMISSLSHINIIKYIPITISDSVPFLPILTEFAKYGDFFDFVISGLFDMEIIIRTYFHQLIAGLEYLHSQGVAHLDLKLENLMMGSDFVLKIIDFDQSQVVTDKRMTSRGTIGYRAPEVIYGACQNLPAADIYSVGVLLYAFKAREYPFPEKTAKDEAGAKATTLKYYSTFLKNNDLFWQMKSKLMKNERFFSEDFKELVNGMLECEVEKRFTLEDIKASKWYNGPILDNEGLKTQIEARWINFNDRKKK